MRATCRVVAAAVRVRIIMRAGGVNAGSIEVAVDLSHNWVVEILVVSTLRPRYLSAEERERIAFNPAQVSPKTAAADHDQKKDFITEHDLREQSRLKEIEKHDRETRNANVSSANRTGRSHNLQADKNKTTKCIKVKKMSNCSIS